VRRAKLRAKREADMVNYIFVLEISAMDRMRLRSTAKKGGYKYCAVEHVQLDGILDDRGKVDRRSLPEFAFVASSCVMPVRPQLKIKIPVIIASLTYLVTTSSFVRISVPSF
jgi:hypothetical protein